MLLTFEDFIKKLLLLLAIVVLVIMFSIGVLAQKDKQLELSLENRYQACMTDPNCIGEERWSDDWTGGGHDSDEDEHGETHDHS